MKTTLEHAGEAIEDPKDTDLERVLAGPRDADWFMALNRGDDDSMEVMVDAGELWVEVTEAERFVQARSRLDEGLVKSMLVSFRDGNDAWRDLAYWKEPPPRKKDTLKGPAGLILGLVAVGLLLVATGIFTGNGGWIVVAFALALPGILAIATVVKTAEVKRAAAWSRANGRVVRSQLVKETRYDKEVEVPKIEYEFTAGFHTFVGTRVSLGELIAGVQAKEALARYPVGKSVAVYYDPSNPADSVLERDLPPFMKWIWPVVGVLTVAIVFGAWWFLIR